MQTLLLNPETWDLMVDVTNSIAVASDPYSKAQDAASAIKLFQGEDYYDTTRGVPYWAQILGKAPPMSLLKAKMVAAAMTVPGVVSARCFIASVIDRRPAGQVQITDQTNSTAAVGF